MILPLCAIVAIILLVIAMRFWDTSGIKETISIACMIFDFFAWAAVIIMCIAAITSNIGLKAKIAENEQLYNSLVYQLENDLYDNDNDIGKFELYERITEWNTDLARKQTMQRDIFLGIFYPNIYDNFELIEFPDTCGS